MPYGFVVLFLDGRNYCFEFYAQYASDEREAREAFRLEALERGYPIKIKSVKPASERRWMLFEKHGDAWHSPNAKAFDK